MEVIFFTAAKLQLPFYLCKHSFIDLARFITNASCSYALSAGKVLPHYAPACTVVQAQKTT